MTTVLVCDDSPLARETLRRAVASVPGVDRVTVAGSGEEVLSRWAGERPELVLMDVRMPGLGGVEASRRLVATYPDAAVVMLTMAEDQEGKQASKRQRRHNTHIDRGKCIGVIAQKRLPALGWRPSTAWHVFRHG